MFTRRSFMGSLAAGAAGAASLTPVARASGGGGLASGEWGAIGSLVGALPVSGDPAAVARDEDFWARVQEAFSVDRSFVNLNNGGVSPSPICVQAAMRRYEEFSNSTPTAYALWTELEPRREAVRSRLAAEWGVSPEEIALTRNSSESLQICQLGLPLAAGDEVLCTTLDYPRMITTFRQRERRDGIALVQIKIPIPCDDPSEIVRRYEAAITPKTRMILASHVINITGQITPVKELVAMARRHNGGIPVVVDGAHALAQIDFKLSDLDCDYYGVSLHKWLAAPHGTGLLYVRRDKIPALWPMMAAEAKLDSDIRKFEEIGTHPAAPYLAIADALTLHQSIGGARKEARLRYLRDRWATRVAGRDRVRLHTSLQPASSCAIGTVQVEGVDSEKLSLWLRDKRKILVTPIKHAEFEGIRVTPSVYSTLEEVDRFSAALDEVVRDGLPAST